MTKKHPAFHLPEQTTLPPATNALVRHHRAGHQSHIMDRSSQPPRDLVYCHQCDNEWYRDEHGLTCPECQSDFTEIIESQHDPRDDDTHIPADNAPSQPPPQQQGHGDFYAPDPDEEDIGNLQWEPSGPGRMRLQGTLHRTVTPEQLRQLRQAQQQGGGGSGGGLMGLLGGFIQSAIGGGQQQQQLLQQQQQQQLLRQQQEGQGHQFAPPIPGNRPSSAPGSPRQGDNGNGNSVRHFEGPGYSMTIATSSSGNLFPRNANGPQPFHPQPEGIDQLMNQMFMNIGAVPPGMHNHGHVHTGGVQMGPGGMMFGGNPFAGAPPPGFPGANAGGPGGMGMGSGPFADIFRMLGMAGQGGAHGDYVFSQEALDRVVTQMMEQQQMGNAPGPASEAAIQSLPKKVVSKSDADEKSGKAECSICMDEVELGTSVTTLPCGHWFHFECVKAWLSEHDTCPQCRQGIMPKNEPDTNRPRQSGQAPAVDMHSPAYQRSQVPGAYPFPGQNSSGAAPSAEECGRPTSSGRRESRSADGSSRGGMFSRMRDTFGS